MRVLQSPRSVRIDLDYGFSRSPPHPFHAHASGPWRTRGAQNSDSLVANRVSASTSSPLPPSRYEVSAGGICVKVQDGLPYVAVLARRTRTADLEWCLPKGHLERGESAAMAAVRELREETGIQGRIICSIRTVNYWFSGKNFRVNKTVHHFLMEYVHGFLTVNDDPDCEGEYAQWVTLTDLQKLLAYPNERKVARAAYNLLYPDAKTISPVEAPRECAAVRDQSLVSISSTNAPKEVAGCRDWIKGGYTSLQVNRGSGQPKSKTDNSTDER